MKLPIHVDGCLCYGCDPAAPLLPNLEWRKEVDGEWVKFDFAEVKPNDRIKLVTVEVTH